MVRPGLWSIGVPFPDNPLGYTLVYLIESDRGPVLVDAGWDDDESWDALVAGFRAAGADIAECFGVLVTHVHPDHHGLSGRVRDASDAWVAMHERDAFTVEHLSSSMARDEAAPGADAAGLHRRAVRRADRRRGHRGRAGRRATRHRSTSRSAASVRSPCRTATSPTASGWTSPGGTSTRCGRPGTRPATCASTSRPSGCCCRATTSSRRSPRTSRSRGATAAATRSATSSTRCGKVAALDATEVLPAHRHRFADLPGTGRRDHPSPPRSPRRHRDDPRRRGRVAVADRRPADVEPAVGAVPADAAPLGGERDRRAPALPDAAQPCRAPQGRPPVHVRPPGGLTA